MDKPRFNLEEHMGINECMHCDSALKARIFCNFMIRNGRKWSNGNSYKYTYFEFSPNSDVFYSFNEGTWGNFPFFLTYPLEFDDFCWTEEAKEPDTVTISRDDFQQAVLKTLMNDVFIVNEDGRNSDPIKLFSYLETLIFGKEDK